MTIGERRRKKGDRNIVVWFESDKVTSGRVVLASDKRLVPSNGFNGSENHCPLLQKFLVELKEYLLFVSSSCTH